MNRLSKRKEVLILIPTNKDKHYCLGKFIKNLKSLDLSNADVLFTEDGIDNEYSDIIKDLGFEVVKVDKTIQAINNGENINIVQCLANTRTKLRQEFIKRKQYKYALWFDSDVIPPKDVVEKFLKNKDKDIVSGIYWQWKTTNDNQKYLHPLAYKYLENEAYDLGVHKYGAEMTVQELFPNRLIGGPHDDIRIVAIGTGIMMTSRKLLEDERWNFRFNPDKPNTTEDMWFCTDLRDLDYEIYLDSNICCRHQMKAWNVKIKNKKNQQ